MNTDKKIQVIIDSTTDLPDSFKERVKVVPLTVSFGKEEYLDGIDLSRDDFYSNLEQGQILPKTSQPSPGAFEKVYKEVREADSQGIMISVASGLSGTYQSACIAAEDYPEIQVIDSKSAAIGTGILVEHALTCIDQGMGMEELMEELKNLLERICVLATLDTLEFLQRGGRISKTAALAGGVLNIKPVVTIKDGQVNVIGKARGAKKANNYLVKKVEESGVDFNLPVLLGYTGTSDKLLHAYIEASTALWEGKIDNLEYSQICTVVGTHAGPGAVAVAFFES